MNATYRNDRTATYKGQSMSKSDDKIIDEAVRIVAEHQAKQAAMQMVQPAPDPVEDRTEYEEIESVDDDAPEPVDLAEAPISEGDPFPDHSDRQLEAMRFDLREQINKLNGHFGCTKEDAKDKITALYEWAQKRKQTSLAYCINHMSDTLTPFALPDAQYPMVCALLANEERDRPILMQMIDSAPVMQLARNERDRAPRRNEYSQWNRDDLMAKTGELGAQVRKITQTLEWRYHKRRALEANEKLADLEQQTETAQ